MECPSLGEPCVECSHIGNVMLCAVCGVNTICNISVLSFNEEKNYCQSCIDICLKNNTICECSVCGYSEFYKSDIPEYSNMCDCCAANKSVEDLEIALDNELSILNKRVNKNYDFENFCYACFGKEGETEINKSDLKGLTELTSVYESEISNYIEYNQPEYCLIVFN